MTPQPSDYLKQWVPEKLIEPFPEPLCQWLFTGDTTFTEPFFDDTIAACKRLAGNETRPYKCVSGLDIMVEWASATDTVSPTAIIFHVSRCGSTLLSQLLASDLKHIVLSEVPFLDEMLRLPLTNQLLLKPYEAYFKAALTFYGQKRNGNEHYLFIKTDSWHLHFYEKLRAMFPQIPFLLLYRHPIEVMQSQRKQRGIQSVPGLVDPRIFGFTDSQVNQANFDIYMAAVLETYFKKMVKIAEEDPLAYFFNYNKGINNITKTVYQMLSLPFDNTIEAKFRKRSLYHAKHPQQHFSEEEADKNNIPDFLSPVFSLYKKLDKMQMHNPAIRR